MGHQMLPIAFSPTDPHCHGNEIRDKMGYNSACVGDFCAYRGFLGMGHRTLPIAFSPTDPHCHGNEIRDKMGYNSACVGDFCAYRGFFGDGPSNGANCIFPQLTPVGMATKSGTKLAITRLA